MDNISVIAPHLQELHNVPLCYDLAEFNIPVHTVSYQYHPHTRAPNQLIVPRNMINVKIRDNVSLVVDLSLCVATLSKLDVWSRMKIVTSLVGPEGNTLVQLPALRTLTLRTNRYNLKRVTDRVYQFVASSCPALETLRLVMCDTTKIGFAYALSVVIESLSDTTIQSIICKQTNGVRGQLLAVGSCSKKRHSIELHITDTTIQSDCRPDILRNVMNKMAILKVQRPTTFIWLEKLKFSMPGDHRIPPLVGASYNSITCRADGQKTTWEFDF